MQCQFLYCLTVSGLCAENNARHEALFGLGIESCVKADAEEELKQLGRNGQMPWCLPEVEAMVPYIAASPSLFALVCPAHCLLHGILQDLFAYALTTKQGDVPRPERFALNKVVFSYEARERVKVRCSTAVDIVTPVSMYMWPRGCVNPADNPTCLPFADDCQCA